jgi:uncharacterized membrane protein
VGVKVGLLLLIFIAAFFELTRSLRQFDDCLIIVGGIGRDADEAAFAQAGIAARVASRAARHFDTGLGTSYFGLAAITWLVHPLAPIAASLLVLAELHRREFSSVVREVLLESGR